MSRCSYLETKSIKCFMEVVAVVFLSMFFFGILPATCAFAKTSAANQQTNGILNASGTAQSSDYDQQDQYVLQKTSKHARVKRRAVCSPIVDMPCGGGTRIEDTGPMWWNKSIPGWSRSRGGRRSSGGFGGGFVGRGGRGGGLGGFLRGGRLFARL